MPNYDPDNPEPARAYMRHYMREYRKLKAESKIQVNNRLKVNPSEMNNIKELLNNLAGIIESNSKTIQAIFNKLGAQGSLMLSGFGLGAPRGAGSCLINCIYYIIT